MLWLDVAGRRHERRLGARGQQRLDAAERAALVLELGLEFGLGLACGRSIGRLGRCIGLPRCTGVLPIAAPKGGHWSNGAEAVQRMQRRIGAPCTRPRAQSCRRGSGRRCSPARRTHAGRRLAPAGGGRRRVCAWQSAKPLRAPAAEAARRSAWLYLSGEAALLLGGRARVARAHILRHVAHDAASEPPHRTLVSLLARLVQLQ